MRLLPRVLIADDDARIRDALREMLLAEGMDVVALAEDGEQAVTLAGECAPDVVVMDLRMPGMSGVDALAGIRARSPNVQVVILSAYDDPELEQSAEAAGAYSYLVKGCAASLVRDVLIEAFDFKQELDAGGGAAGDLPGEAEPT